MGYFFSYTTVGHLKITSNTTANDVLDQKSLDRLSPGGFYRPADCNAREKVAIIIPYRLAIHVTFHQTILCFNNLEI